MHLYSMTQPFSSLSGLKTSCGNRGTGGLPIGIAISPEVPNHSVGNGCSGILMLRTASGSSRGSFFLGLCLNMSICDLLNIFLLKWPLQTKMFWISTHLKLILEMNAIHFSCVWIHSARGDWNRHYWCCCSLQPHINSQNVAVLGWTLGTYIQNSQIQL